MVPLGRNRAKTRVQRLYVGGDTGCYRPCMAGRHALGAERASIAKRALSAAGIVFSCVLVLAVVLGVPALISYTFVTAKWPLPGLWSVAALTVGILVTVVVVRASWPSYRVSSVLLMWPAFFLARAIYSPSPQWWILFASACTIPLASFWAVRRELRQRRLARSGVTEE
jgi:hypothetical protein